MNPRLFKSALATFFVLGLGAPLAFVVGGKAAGELYQFGVYLVSAAFFWVWLSGDSKVHSVSRPWSVLVGVAWLVASVFAASAYLLFTRGMRKGSIAVLALFAIVLQFFAVLAVGAVIAVGAINVFGPFGT